MTISKKIQIKQQEIDKYKSIPRFSETAEASRRSTR
jgi:hypothetical protein